MAEQYTNRLAKEKSPYLLQHAHNPVDWYPWGEEAFRKAREENKPIFLSIGYSTCHWCHVMERESFENSEIAKVLNENFIAIKVDREERPDIDHAYMSVVTAITGSGGWPLSAFLTPEKEPFYGGTYFPPEPRWGSPGFKRLLLTIADTWKNRREEILQSGKSITAMLKEQSSRAATKGITLGVETLSAAFRQFSQNFDGQYGGFGTQPKFPSSHNFSFLLRYHKKTKEAKALLMVEQSLSSMAKGGMCDHLGGGFHRYSTDRKWHVPHFEKMLYDQAVLSRTYLEAYQLTKNEDNARVAREVFDYVLRDMTSPEGGFFSAEDADSIPPEESGLKEAEKKEGAFFIWGKKDIESIVGPGDAEIFNFVYGVEDNGNAELDPHGEFVGKNILYLAHTKEEAAAHFKKPVNEIEKTIKRAKEKLFAARRERPKPHLDDKVLVDWNGLMIGSLAFGSRVLNEPRYLDAAEKAAGFILNHLMQKGGRLLHRYRDGEAAIPATITDYAFFIEGLLDLYEATFKNDYLKEAKRLGSEMIRLFWDDKNGGFFITANDVEEILFHQKEIYDGAIPSGNSIAALDLIRLGRLTLVEEFEKKAQALFEAFAGEIARYPAGYTQMLMALDFAMGPSKEIVIAGEKENPLTQAMIRAVWNRFTPNKVVAFRPSSEKEAKGIIALAPFLEEQAPLDGKTTAYVCENHVCRLPVNEVKKLEELLDGM